MGEGRHRGRGAGCEEGYLLVDSPWLVKKQPKFLLTRNPKERNEKDILKRRTAKKGEGSATCCTFLEDWSTRGGFAA